MFVGKKLRYREPLPSMLFVDGGRILISDAGREPSDDPLFGLLPDGWLALGWCKHRRENQSCSLHRHNVDWPGVECHMKYTLSGCKIFLPRRNASEFESMFTVRSTLVSFVAYFQPPTRRCPWVCCFPFFNFVAVAGQRRIELNKIPPKVTIVKNRMMLEEMGKGTGCGRFM